MAGTCAVGINSALYCINGNKQGAQKEVHEALPPRGPIKTASQTIAEGLSPTQGRPSKLLKTAVAKTAVPQPITNSCTSLNSLLGISDTKLTEINESFLQAACFSGRSKNFNFMLKFLPETYYFMVITKAFLTSYCVALNLREDVANGNSEASLQAPPFSFTNCICELNLTIKVAVLVFREESQEKNKEFWNEFFINLALFITRLGDYSVHNKWLYQGVLGFFTTADDNPFTDCAQNNQERWPLRNIFQLDGIPISKETFKKMIHDAALLMKEQFFRTFNTQAKGSPSASHAPPALKGPIDIINKGIDDAWHDALLMLIQVRAEESKTGVIDAGAESAINWLKNRAEKFNQQRGFLPGDVSESTISAATQMCPIKFVQNSQNPCFKEIIPSLNKLFLEVCASNAV